MRLNTILGILLAGLSLPLTAEERPNIILIMVDDMGFSDIGCYGSEIPTPHLNALAQRGARFSQFYNTGRCCPTRASLLTGLYSHQAGIGWMTTDQGVPGYRGALNDNCHTIAEVLGEAGYLTAITGKWHVGYSPTVNPTARGFLRSLNLELGGIHFWNQTGRMASRRLHFNGEQIPRDDPRLSPPWYGSDLWTEQGIKFLDEARAAQKPLFWYLAHVAPHFPCMAPEATIAKYRGKYRRGWDKLARERHARQVESGLIDKDWTPEVRPKDIPAWSSLRKKEKERYDDMMAIYAAMIEEIDKNVGKLVDALRERDELENTLILFFADNGGNAETGIKGRYEGENPGDAHSNVFIGKCWAHLNNVPFREYKHYNHEGGIATPLIAHWPAKVKPHKNWIRTPTHLIDLMATCVDLGKASYSKTRKGQSVPPMEGQSLQPLLTGSGTFPARPLFWEHEGNAAIRVGEEKLVRRGEKGPWELFNLAKDRTEQKDLAAQKAQRVTALSAQWEEWARRCQVLPKPKPKSAPKSNPKKTPNPRKATSRLFSPPPASSSAGSVKDSASSVWGSKPASSELSTASEIAAA